MIIFKKLSPNKNIQLKKISYINSLYQNIDLPKTNSKRVYIKYFLIYKKKRKTFKFFGNKVKLRKNLFLITWSILNKEKFFLNFFLFNPFLIQLKLQAKKWLLKINYLHKFNFSKALIDMLISQYHFKKYIFLIKTKYRFKH